MTRTAYAHQLQDLQDAGVLLASMVDKAMARSVEALQRQDVHLARRVMAEDRAINQTRWQIEEDALRVIATQSPMAGDLRRVAAVIHLATDLERMADHAAGIAKIAVETAGEPLLKPLVDIPRMGELARDMLADSITAFIAGDAETARRIVARDDVVDSLYNQVYRDLLTYMLADPTTIPRATHLLWAAHNVERVADHVTNICERVVFAVTGELEELAVSTY